MPPRFTPGRLSCGWVVCVWLWTSAGAFAAVPTVASPAAVSYQHALEAFNHADYARALSLLEPASAGGVKDGRERADVFNLKGAILLRQGRYAEARAAFDEAADADPALWAARFNQAEVDFREKRYADSHRQFSNLLGHTSRLWHTPEHRFIEYKLMLTDLLGGNEKPATDFIAAHAADETHPLAWYYLNAALDYRHGQPAVAEAYLQEASKNHAASSEQVYADSFATLGWSTHRTGAESALAKASPDRRDKRLAAKPVAKTLAVVQLMPDGEAGPAAGSLARFRASALQAAHAPEETNMPPSEAGMDFSTADEGAALVRASSSPVAGVLARRRTAHPSPSPSASPADSPAADGTTGSSASPLPSPDEAASPAPAATPGGTPSSAFVQKYEAAMVQFLQKNYPETKKLLDEADAIQPNQPNSVGLRNQLFKQYYEAAYAAYQHADYAGALSQLDGADGVGSNAQNQSDAYNLRGLVLSKQRNYPEAENMFHKAIQTDPGLWAAKFNYAEVPFNYRNFTVARTRFEELFSQTDPAKQPVEAELTQFKVFLTLLLEGKEDAARTFMQHFNFSGATPARYFCQAALNFYTGDVDKAQGWIDSARKEYPARKSSSFLEAFYRVGWLTDPNAPAIAPATALAAASPAPTVVPAPMTAASPAPAIAVSTPAPSPAAPPKPALAAASPAATVPGRPAALPTPLSTMSPAAVAMTTPAVAPATAKITATPAASVVPTPALAKATPTPAVAKATPIPAATAAPTAPAVAKVPVVPAAPSPSATAVALATPRPATPAPVARVAAATPPPAPAAAETPAEAVQPAAGGGDFVRVLIVGAVALYFLYVVGRILLSVMNPKPKRTGKGKTPAPGSREAAAADQIEAPRR